MSTQPAVPNSVNVRRIYYLIGLTGATLLLVGMFMPSIRQVDEDDKSYLQFFPVEAILLLILVVVSLGLMKLHRLRLLLFIGVLSLGVIAESYFRNEHQKSARIDKAYSMINSSNDKDPRMRKLREDIADYIRLSEEAEKYRLGWGVMIVGSAMLLGAGLLTYSSVEQRLLTTFALFEQPEKKCPSCAGFNVAEAVKCKHCGETIG